MDKIKIQRYKHPKSVGFIGWVELDKYFVFIESGGVIASACHGENQEDARIEI